MACDHPRLRFGSGGYYIFCNSCDASWIAWKMGEDERVPGVTKGQPICGSSHTGDLSTVRPDVKVEMGPDGKVRCARCKKQDYPLENHICKDVPHESSLK